MKAKIVVLMLMGLFMFCLNGQAQDKKTKKSNKEEVVFDVSMDCQNCKKKIEKNIAFEKGVTDMKVNLADKTVTIIYQSDKTDKQKLQKAFDKLGYTANEHQNVTDPNNKPE